MTVRRSAGAALGAAPPRRPGAPPVPRPQRPIGFLVPAVVLLAAFAALSADRAGPDGASATSGRRNIVGVWNWVGLDELLGRARRRRSCGSRLLRTAGVCVVLLASNLVLGFLVASILSTAGRITNTRAQRHGLRLGAAADRQRQRLEVPARRLRRDQQRPRGRSGIGPVNWLSSPDLALWTVVGRGGLGGAAVLGPDPARRAAGHPPDVIEAAAIDGAGYWRTQFQIVLPLLRPTMWILGDPDRAVRLQVLRLLLRADPGRAGHRHEHPAGARRTTPRSPTST